MTDIIKNQIIESLAKLGKGKPFYKDLHGNLIHIFKPNEIIQVANTNEWHLELAKINKFKPFHPYHLLRIHLYGNLGLINKEEVVEKCICNDVLLTIDEDNITFSEQPKVLNAKDRKLWFGWKVIKDDSAFIRDEYIEHEFNEPLWREYIKLFEEEQLQLENNIKVSKFPISLFFDIQDLICKELNWLNLYYYRGSIGWSGLPLWKTLPLERLTVWCLILYLINNKIKDYSSEEEVLEKVRSYSMHLRRFIDYEIWHTPLVDLIDSNYSSFTLTPRANYLISCLVDSLATIRIFSYKKSFGDISKREIHNDTLSKFKYFYNCLCYN